jgi:hypothetical protein
MINDLVKWVADKIGDQRSYMRKSERFPVSWLIDDKQKKEGQGLEISASGVVFQTRERPKSKEMNLVMMVREREIRTRVTVKRKEITIDGYCRCVCRFLGIAADDWDAIQRFVHDEPEPDNKGYDEIKELQSKEDNAYRLLPLRVQNELVAKLVGMNRLEPPPKDHAPVMRMHYIGSNRESGREIRRFNVHSRKRVDDHWYAFDTQFTIDGSGTIELMK